ncbi:MAG TPA: M20/M25/M40 family metallo-hydrolase [Kofleriaceae bacterium]|nr:M20/M25/M40 family metallo-hydrolase [Kofleriaceae bacterium]
MHGAKWSLSLLVAALLGGGSCCPPEPAVSKTTPTPPTAGSGDAAAGAVKPPGPPPKDMALPEERHLRNMRQLTFGGDNAEAYWAFGGDRLILQSNRKPYQCDQIEILPVTGTVAGASGEPKLVSTGKGRTTCAYFLKGDKEIVYASTHASSPTCPTPPDNSKGYLWGLFEYDIYRANADGSNLRNLTPNTPGYDAEATVCPKDGSIIFTSTRSGDLELWRMDADGKNLRQLTSMPGYDGGAFFSADCSKIVWRSSRPTGKDLDEYKALLGEKLVKPTRMDLYVANADGSDARQVTYLPGASFAPYFFPDGKRIIFASNYLNPRSAEFDLFAIDIDGTHLERVTFSGGFDGFPVFSPDGKTLSFSSNRRDVEKATISGKEVDVYRMTGKPAGPNDTNVFVAEWVDAPDGPSAARPTAPETEAADRYADLVRYLADDAREGRGVGTKGLEDALAHVQQKLAEAGVEPAVPGWRQEFEVTTDVRRGAATAVALDDKPLAAEDFAPVAGAKRGAVTGAATGAGEVVAVGWGIVDKDTKLDDYKGKNVRGKVALVHRFVPPDQKLEPRDASRLGELRYKAFTAKGAGATALVVIDDGDPKAEEAALPKPQATESEAGIPIVVVTRKAGAALRAGTHRAKVTVALEPVRTKTANLVGVIRAGAATKQAGAVVVGAHIDHLGMGGPSSLAPSAPAVHNGADDNASGTAALVEVARQLAAKKGELQRDVYIVSFSAEEMGTLGAHHFVKNPPLAPVQPPNAKTKPVPVPIVAMLNMDMVGRMKMNQLHIHGGESAKEWKDIVAPICAAARVTCDISGSGYGPSDHMPFYIAGVPVLFMFTGSHREYHTPSDDADKINAAGAVRIAGITAGAALAAANRTEKLTFVKTAPVAPMGGDVRRRGASLGTVPSYDKDPNQPKGMVISDVVPNGPAAKAGLRANDRIIQIGTHEIATVEDLMFVLQKEQPGTTVTITFVRDGKTQTTSATFAAPSSRR